MRLAFALSLTLFAAYACGSDVQISGAASGSGANSGAGGATSTASQDDSAASVGGGTPYCPGTTLPGDCSLALQDCPSSMECVVEGSGANARSACANETSGRDLPIGRYCTDDTDCVFGTLCTTGYCTRFCCDGDNSPCLGWSCNVLLDFGGGIGAMICAGEYAPCDIFEPSSCEPGKDCHISDQGPIGCFDPAAMQSDENGPCTTVEECKDGQGCIQNICRYYCEGSSTQPPGYGGCPSGRSCMQVNDTTFACVP